MSSASKSEESRRRKRIDDEAEEAAADNDSSSKRNKRRKKKGDDSDGSASESDGESAASGSEAEGGGGGGGGSDNEDDGYDAEFMGDAADRAHLASLPSLEREQIIFDRSEARRVQEERRAANQQMSAREKGKAAAASAGSKKGKHKQKKDKKDKDAKKAEKAAAKAEKKAAKKAAAAAAAAAENEEKEEEEKSKPTPASRAKRDEKRSANDALADLLARKTQKITSKASSSKRLRSSGGGGGGDGEDDEGEGGEEDGSEGDEDGSDAEMEDAAAARRRRSRGKKKYDSDGEDELKDVADSGAAGGGDDEDDSYTRVRTPVQFANVKSIQLRRVALEKIVEEPFFNELVTGMFVRVNVGMREDGAHAYRLCQISGVQEWKSKYKFGNPPRDIKIALLLKFGKAERLWSMALISNQSVEPAEFEKWKKQMEEDNVTPLCAEDCARLRKKATTLRQTFEYSPEIIAKLIEEKRMAGSRDLRNSNLTAERNRLIFELNRARDSGNAELLRRLQKQYDELEEMERRLQSRSTAGSSKSSDAVFGILNINKRNVQENTDKMEAMMKQQREAKRQQEAEAKRQQELTGEAPAAPKRDAFKRKETRPTMEFIANAEEVADATKKAAAAEKAAKEAAKKASEADASLRRMHAARNKLEHFDDIDAAHHAVAASPSPVAPAKHSRFLQLPSLPSISDKLEQILHRKHQGVESLHIDESANAQPQTTMSSVLGRFVSSSGGGSSVPFAATSQSRFAQRPADDIKIMTAEEYFNVKAGM